MLVRIAPLTSRAQTGISNRGGTLLSLSLSLPLFLPRVRFASFELAARESYVFREAVSIRVFHSTTRIDYIYTSYIVIKRVISFRNMSDGEHGRKIRARVDALLFPGAAAKPVKNSPLITPPLCADKVNHFNGILKKLT